MAEKSYKNEHELKKRLDSDYYMFCAVRECYGSLKSIVKDLVQGEQEKK
jgi:callose synthase